MKVQGRLSKFERNPRDVVERLRDAAASNCSAKDANHASNGHDDCSPTPTDAHVPCRRCHGNGEEPNLPSVEQTITAAMKFASWSEWPPEVTRTKLERILQPGDRLAGITWWAIIVERPSGELISVPRHDA